MTTVKVPYRIVKSEESPYNGPSHNIHNPEEIETGFLNLETIKVSDTYSMISLDSIYSAALQNKTLSKTMLPTWSILQPREDSSDLWFEAYLDAEHNLVMLLDIDSVWNLINPDE